MSLIQSRRPHTPWGLMAVCGVIGLLFVGPPLYLVIESIRGGEDLGALYTSGRTLDWLGNTVSLAVATAASSIVVGTGLAWLTVRTDLPLRRIWVVLAALPLVFPSFVGALALMGAVAPGGLLPDWFGWIGIDPFRPEGFWGAWFVLTLFTSPYVLLPVAARLAALPPSLEESARLLGRRPAAVFVSVVLPQISGAIAAGALLVFLYAISDFGVVTLLRYQTLTQAIYETRNTPASSLPLSLLLAVVALLVVSVERAAARRQHAGAMVSGGRSLRVPLGWWRWPALGIVAAWVLLALGGPVASLSFWAWRGLSGNRSSLAGGGDDNLLAGLSTPAWGTVSISIVTALVAVAVVLPLAYLSARHRHPSGDVINGLVAAGFALPGLVVALAVVSWVIELPRGWNLYQSFTVLVAGYVIHLGVQSLRAAQVAVASVPKRLDESARMLGAGWLRRFTTIELPLMLPGLAAGGGLVLLSTMKELPITLLVAPLGFETLATRIWSGTESNFLAEAGLASLVLVALSGLLTWLLVIRRTEWLA